MICQGFLKKNKADKQAKQSRVYTAITLKVGLVLELLLVC